MEVELPEGNLEPALPLPLIFAKGLVELDTDLDTLYLRKYFHDRILQGQMLPLSRGNPSDKSLLSSGSRKVEVAKLVSQQTGIPFGLVWRMAFLDAHRPDQKAVFNNMANELEPWDALLGKEVMNEPATRSNIQSQATRLFGLPDRSAEYVKRSWEKWRH